MLTRFQGYRANSFIYHKKDGYYYYFNRATPHLIYFRCIAYGSKGCRGRARFCVQSGFAHGQAHNHDPDFWLAGERHLWNSVLSSCQDLEHLTFKDILSRHRVRYVDEVARRVTLPRMRNCMRRVRTACFPNIPNSLTELRDILQTPQYRIISSTKDLKDNMFACHVRAEDGSNNIIFASKRALKVMKHTKVVHADGTFKSRPSVPPSSQLYCILTTWRHHTLPLCFVLMERKSLQAYKAVLRRLKALVPMFRPDRVITDFEDAQQAAWESVYHVHVQGCLWHYTRAIAKHAKGLGLARRMDNTPRIKTLTRMCCAVPLVPEGMMENAFMEIVTEARECGHIIERLMEPLFQYVYAQWIGHNVHSKRICVYGSEERTNNACESFNRWLRHEVGAHHPNVYSFISALARIEHNTHLDFLTLRSGRMASRTRSVKAVMNDARIIALTHDLLNIQHVRRRAMKNFLHAAAHTVQEAFDAALEEY